MNLQKASGFKYGALFTLEDLLGTWFDLAEGVLVLPSPEPTCFGEAPSAAGAQSHFFLIFPMVPLKMTWLGTGKAPSGLHLLGLHGMGHFHP